MNNKIKILLAFLGVVSLVALTVAAWMFFYTQTEIDKFAQSEKELKKQSAFLEKRATTFQKKFTSAQKDALEWKEKADTIAKTLNRLGQEHTLLVAQYEVLLKEKTALNEKNKNLAAQIENIDNLYSQAQQQQQVPVDTSDTFLALLLQEKAALQVEVDGLKSRLSSNEAKIESLGVQAQPFEKVQEEKEFLKKQLQDAQKITELLSNDLLEERKKRWALEESMAAQNAGVTLARNASKEVTSAGVSVGKIVSDGFSSEPNKMYASIQLPPIVVKAEETNQPREIYLPRLSRSRLVEVEEPQGVPLQLEPEKKEIPDGRIITLNKKHKFVVVNIGGEDGLEKGMSFKVYRNTRKVGILEVIEVRKNIAACDITDLNSGALKINDIVRR